MFPLWHESGLTLVGDARKLRDMTRMDIAAGTEEMTRQKRWKIIRFRRGECITCGKPRKDSTYSKRCAVCGENTKKKRRKLLNSEPWQPGRRGRPPLALKQEEQQ
jgi:hypothetical protein